MLLHKYLNKTPEPEVIIIYYSEIYKFVRFIKDSALEQNTGGPFFTSEGHMVPEFFWKNALTQIFK